MWSLSLGVSRYTTTIGRLLYANRSATGTRLLGDTHSSTYESNSENEKPALPADDSEPKMALMPSHNVPHAFGDLIRTKIA
jgi:hypothetical protein